MTFSITPAMLGINGQNQPGQSQEKSNAKNVPQVAQSNQGSMGSGDLIEFSLTPAVLNKYKSSAVYNPGSRSRLLDDSRRSLSHSNTSSPFHSPSVSPVPSRKSPQMSRVHPPLPPDSALTQFHSGALVGEKSPAHSPSQFRSSTPKSNTESDKNLTLQEINKINLKWDHFGHLNSPPQVHIAPQKLLPAQHAMTKDGVASSAHHRQASPTPQLASHNSSSSKSSSKKGTRKKGEEDKHIQQDWTLVNQTDPGKMDGVSALHQLRRIVSQPGFEDADEALVPMGGDPI